MWSSLVPAHRRRRPRYPLAQRYSPLAVTPHCTNSCTVELAGNVAMVSPVVNSAVAPAATGVFNARLLGQLAPPVVEAQVAVLQFKPAENASLTTAPPAADGPRLLKVMV